MQLVESLAFQEWCDANHIGRSVLYPHSEQLTYLPEEGRWYRFRPNTTPHGLALFVDSAVSVAAAGVPILAIPTWRGGRWWPMLDDSVWCSKALAAVISGVGIPREYVGAIRFDVTELVLVTLLLTNALQFAAPGFWELSVLPEHGRCILKNEEDGDLIGTFPTDSARDMYTAALRGAGWREPTEADPRVSETDPWLTIQPDVDTQ